MKTLLLVTGVCLLCYCFINQVKSSKATSIFNIIINLFLSVASVENVSISSEQTPCISSLTVITCTITLNTVIGPDLSVLNYTWYHNNINITNKSEIFKQSEVLNQSNLVITRLNIMSVLFSDTGMYECRANIIDSSVTINDSLFLVVQGKVCLYLYYISSVTSRSTYCHNFLPLWYY